MNNAEIKVVQILCDLERDGHIKILSPIIEVEQMEDGRWILVAHDPGSPGYLAWGVVENDGTFHVWGDQVRAEDLWIPGYSLAEEVYDLEHPKVYHYTPIEVH